MSKKKSRLTLTEKDRLDRRRKHIRKLRLTKREQAERVAAIKRGIQIQTAFLCASIIAAIGNARMRRAIERTFK